MAIGPSTIITIECGRAQMLPRLDEDYTSQPSALNTALVMAEVVYGYLGVVLAQHSDQALNAILSMADRQDLLLARKAEDLRRKVFELAAITGGAICSRPDT